jgi:EAL and modified HD-GYP domain-containing signal transduction protein
MEQFREIFRHRAQALESRRLPGGHWSSLGGVAESGPCEVRQFALQPIVGPDEQGFEALFRAGWEDAFSGEPNVASRIMVDNWLLFGFEELIGGRTVFLNCTRETLMSGFLWLLPRSAVLEILESVQPDEEVLRVCQEMKAAGYRFALDDFESPDNMERFLELADFIKVDFRHLRRTERARILRELEETGATLIAEKIESKEEFLQAVDEGFGMFQGYWIGKHINYVNKVESLDAIFCARLAQAVEERGFDLDELEWLVRLAPGLERRLLRRANWLSPAEMEIDSVRNALELTGETEFRGILTLAVMAASEIGGIGELSEPMAMGNGTDPLIRWIDPGAETSWWLNARQTLYRDRR